MDQFSQNPQQYQASANGTSWRHGSSARPLRLLAIVSVLSLVVAGSAYWISQRPGEAPKLAAVAAANTNSDEDGEGHKYEAVVDITSSGITPSTLKVKPGTRVYFQNKDSKPHSVTATSAPEDSFGSDQAIEAGSGYAYSFTKVGTYTFYDSAASPDAQSGGQVIVEN